MRLSLLIPHLLWPEPEDRVALENLSCPGLEWLLAHGRAGHRAPVAYEHALAAAFGLPADAPFGALRLLGEASQPRPDGAAGFWLCADPVHLRFHHERIILADAGAFDLEEEEALRLAADLNREFADVGEFHVAAPRRWYLRLHAAGEFPALPLSAVAGRRMDGQLPAQPQASRLRAWLNEMQMFLHGHPVNSQRAQAGKPAVNSLWLWGAGSLPEGREKPYDAAWADDPLALGLARAAGIPTRPLPQSLPALLAQPAPGSHRLAVVDHLLPPVLYDDSRSWREQMERLEKDWFMPLRQALGGELAAITLLAPTLYGQLAWEVKAGDRWKLWRRPRPITADIKELAR